MALFFLGFLAFVVTVGARFGIRAVRAFREANARVNADIAFLRALPSDECAERGPTGKRVMRCWFCNGRFPNECTCGSDRLTEREAEEECWEPGALTDEPADPQPNPLFEMAAADRRVADILDHLDEPAAADPRPAVVSPGAVSDPHASPAPGRPDLPDYPGNK